MARLTFYVDGEPCYRTKCYSPLHMKNVDTRILGGPVATKLAAYEDAEEQGRLLTLPCKINAELWVAQGNELIKGRYRGIEMKAVSTDDTVRLDHCLYSDDDRSAIVSDDYFADKVFFTREEARAALAARKGGVGE